MSVLAASIPLRRLSRTSALIVATALLGATAAPAQAARGDGLEPSLAVLELYVGGQEFAKTPEYVAKVAEELGKLQGYSLLSRADAARQVGAVMTTSVRRVTDEKLDRIAAMMKRGEDLLYKEPREAITILAQAKRELNEIMESITQTKRIREDFFKTQMLLARSHYDNDNRSKAAEIIEEIIRVFGEDARVTEDEYHPDLVALYRATYRKVSAEPKGALQVTVHPAGAEIRIHGKTQASRAPTTIEGIFPGTVAVQARIEGRESMIRRVKVVANETASITIDIDYETSLSFNDEKFGFTFPDVDTLKRRVGDFGARIGKLLRVDKILVTGLVEAAGRTQLEGYMVDVASGQVERAESLLTKPNVVSRNRVKLLANYLGKGVAVERVYKPWYENWVGWTATGVGVVGMVVGGILWMDYESQLDEVNCTQPPPACKSELERTTIASDAKSVRALAVTSWALGGAAIVGGILAFVLMEEEDIGDEASASGVPRLRTVGPTLSPNGSPGVSASFSF